MSRFYGDLNGQARTEATRRGSAGSGVNAHVRGWDLGVRAGMWPQDDSHDSANVVLTGGSHGYRSAVGVFEAVESEHFGRAVVILTMAEAFGGRSYVITEDGNVSEVVTEIPASA